MRRFSRTIAILASLCLVPLQLSGFHLHIDAEGSVGNPGLSHLHAPPPRDPVHGDHPPPIHADHGHTHHGQGHEHGDQWHDDHEQHGDFEDIRDLSLLDLTLSSFKSPYALPVTLPDLAASAPAGELAVNDFVSPVLSGRHTRWRPPLRAPPARLI